MKKTTPKKKAPAKPEARKKAKTPKAPKPVSPAALAKAEEVKAGEKRGEQIMLASNRGFELSHKYMEKTVLGIESLLGDRFRVSESGLKVTSGPPLTETEAARAVATLAEVTERGDAVRGTSMLALGDLIVYVKKTFGDKAGGELIEQAVSVVGRSKHTVQEAERVVAAFPLEGRPKGLSYTHLQILKDAKGSGEVTPAKLSKIIETVQEGEVVSTIIMDGKKKDQRKALSCAKTKSLINEAKGKPEGSKPPKKKKSKEAEGLKGYLYVFLEDSNQVFVTGELDKEACASGLYTVIDLDGACVLSEKGHLYAAIKPLPVKAAPAEPEKAKPRKKEKEEAPAPAADADEMPE